MPLVDMKDMLQHAYQHNYAVTAFDVVNLDFLQGIVLAAEQSRAPVILRVSESTEKQTDFQLLLGSMEIAAKRALVPIAIQYSKAKSVDAAINAINSGCNGVSLDETLLDFSENIRNTKQLVEIAKTCGASVKGGLLYSNDDNLNSEDQTSYTSVAEAKAFVERTGVDFLGVCIGIEPGNPEKQNHLQTKSKPRIDYQRLKQLNESLQIPLIISDCDCLSDDQIRRLICQGVAQINYTALLPSAVARQLNKNMKSGNQNLNDMLGDIQQTVALAVEQCMLLTGSAGRAAEVLSRCYLWSEVEHLVMFNTEDNDQSQIINVMSEGRRVFSKIPGVRKVTMGDAIENDAKYQYAWCITFCHPSVIDGFYKHPDYLSFTNKYFHPIARQALNIDYQVVEPNNNYFYMADFMGKRAAS